MSCRDVQSALAAPVLLYKAALTRRIGSKVVGGAQPSALRSTRFSNSDLELLLVDLTTED